MAYTEYLQRLLAPLGVYDLREDSVSGAMVAALGDELDELWQALQEDLPDFFPQTAGQTALNQWEQVLPRYIHPEALADRHSALSYLLSRDDVNCSASAVTEALAACGIEAVVDEPDEDLSVAVHLTSTSMTEAELAELKLFVRGLVPAHLALSWPEES